MSRLTKEGFLLDPDKDWQDSASSFGLDQDMRAPQTAPRIPRKSGFSLGWWLAGALIGALVWFGIGFTAAKLFTE